MNTAIQEFTKSVIITTVISLLFAICFYLINGIIGFITGFIISFLLQYIITYLWKTYLIYKSGVSIAAIEADVKKVELEQLAKQNIDVTCAFCNANNRVTVSMNKENAFKCNSCNQNNIILINLSTAQMTLPIDDLDVYEKIQSISVSNVAQPIEFK